MSIEKNVAGLLSVSYNAQSLHSSIDAASDSKGTGLQQSVCPKEAHTFSFHNLLINLINLSRLGKTKSRSPLNIDRECGGRA